MKKRAYRSVRVKDVLVKAVLEGLPEGRVWVGVDVGKETLLAVLRDCRGEFSCPWKIVQPGELRLFVDRLGELAAVRELVVVLESTGTYGDALRQALHRVGISVHRVRTQAASQFAETFDGVPSQHDGKDAAILAELGAIGKSVPWQIREAEVWQDQLRGQVQWIEAQQNVFQQWLGRLESCLARHWPEVQRLLPLRSATLLKILMKFGGPAGLPADEEQALRSLEALSRGQMATDRLRNVIESARTTVGMPMSEEHVQFVKRQAKWAWAARKEIVAARKVLKGILAQQKILQQMGRVVGPTTACVLYDRVGDPRVYDSGPAYRKAMGLNLREHSSGARQGALTITRRGPGVVRKWLYFSALRWIQRLPLKAWYAARKDPRRKDGKRLVIALMRRLALAVHATAVQNKEFDPARVFPGRDPKSKKSKSQNRRTAVR